MTSEHDFWTAICADRSDRLTFGVFADWLDERGDPRGPVVRMLGVRGRRPWAHNPYGGPWPTDWTFHWYSAYVLTQAPEVHYSNREAVRAAGAVLPSDWYNRLPGLHRDGTCGFWNERAALEAAVIAFLAQSDECQRVTMERELRRGEKRNAKKRSVP